MQGASRATRWVALLSLVFVTFALVRGWAGDWGLGTSSSYKTLAARVAGGWGNPAGWHIRRYELLKNKLPPGEPVGFLSEHVLGLPHEFEEFLCRVFMVQYAMLPHVLTDPESARFSIGYWKDPDAVRPVLQERGYELVLDAGAGIALYSRRRP